MTDDLFPLYFCLIFPQKACRAESRTSQGYLLPFVHQSVTPAVRKRSIFMFSRTSKTTSILYAAPRCRTRKAGSASQRPLRKQRLLPEKIFKFFHGRKTDRKVRAEQRKCIAPQNKILLTRRGRRPFCAAARIPHAAYCMPHTVSASTRPAEKKWAERKLQNKKSWHV